MEHATLDSAMTLADRFEIPVVPPGEDELPYSDGVPLESFRHVQQMMLLTMSLRHAWRDRHDFYTAGDMFVYYSEHQVKNNDFRGPDVFVVLDTSDRERKSWVAWGEDGKLPDIVIELLSDSTRHIDRGEKMHIYSHIWKVAQYYLYDPFSHEFEGYRLSQSQSFVPIAPAENGDLPCPRLGLNLGIRQGQFMGEDGPWLRWISAAGEPLPTGDEDSEAKLRYAMARLEHEAAELERSKAITDAERARADAERTRADAERARADAERDRAEEAERKLRDLEAKLGQK